MTSAPAIGFEYRASRQVAGLFALVTLLAVLAVMLSGMSWSLRILLTATAIFGCYRAVRRLSLPIHAVGWANQSGWTLRGADGADDQALLLSSRCMSSAVLLRLASQRYGRLTLWLMPDNSDTDIRRRLRMRLAVLRDHDQGRE